MKKIARLLAISFLLASCSSGNGSGDSKGSPGGGSGGGVGEFSDATPTPMDAAKQKNELAKIMMWMQQMTNGSYQKIYSGSTTDGKPCSLYLADLTYDPVVSSPGSYYIGLGTSSNLSNNTDNYTYIGTRLTQYSIFNNLQATVQYILVNKNNTEPIGGGDVNMKNEVVVNLNQNGKPKSAVGRSSYWPSSVCNFN
jgi:hypothetical protein